VKTDLDHLMTVREMTALLVFIDENLNPAMDYLANGVHLTGGFVLKKQGAAPVLVVNPMETDEAEQSGLQVLSMNALGWSQLREQAANDDVAKAQLVARMLAHFEVSPGTVGVYGVAEVNVVLAIIDWLRQADTPYAFTGEAAPTLLDEAAATKDAAEIERIKSVAARTNQVLQVTWDFLGSHHAQDDGTVVKIDGDPLTIGEVKNFIRRELMARGLQESGMIFAQGRDAGFPHSRGRDTQTLKTGQTIVFDLFPYEAGGGYYHDTTRTWCLGYAPPEVAAAYETVKTAYDIAVEAFAVGKATATMQHAVQDYLEAQGHPTARSHSGTEVGYPHGLGHGLGLKVHEAPSISHLREEPTFERGHVITIEPGLYYPDEGYGLRLENTLYVDESGALVTLTDFPDTLVLPLRKPTQT